MKIRPEQIDSRIEQCVEAWRAARQHSAAIADETVRAVADKIADSLRDESIRAVLAPLFKAAVKGKAARTGKPAKADKAEKKSKKKGRSGDERSDDAVHEHLA